MHALILSSVVATVVGLTGACKCLDRPFCVAIADAVNVARVVVVNATDVTDTRITYSLNLTRVYKGDNVTELRTSSSSASCGLSLELGAEYLVASDTDHAAHSCGPTRPWTSLTPDDVRVLDRGGLCTECNSTACAPYQACRVDARGAPFCADTCAKGRCAADEICSLASVDCLQAPCPDVAVCETCTKLCLDVYEPVCGSDARTYGNACALSNAACTDPTLTTAYEGECKPTCDGPCPRLYDPICATNGQTYANACELKNAVCRDPALKRAYDGVCCNRRCCPYQECRRTEGGEEYCADRCHPDRCGPGQKCTLDEVECVRAPCPPVANCHDCNAIACPLVYDPVCGTDGVTYGNPCLLTAGQCRDPGLTEAGRGPCSCKERRRCPKTYQPVCASNGKTYGNRCLFVSARCDNKALTVAYDGECRPALKTTPGLCRKGCSRDWQPVCSNQGVTYGNRCVLDEAACEDSAIQFHHDGECSCTATPAISS